MFFTFFDIIKIILLKLLLAQHYFEKHSFVLTDPVLSSGHNNLLGVLKHYCFSEQKKITFIILVQKKYFAMNTFKHRLIRIKMYHLCRCIWIKNMLHANNIIIDCFQQVHKLENTQVQINYNTYYNVHVVNVGILTFTRHDQD